MTDRISELAQACYDRALTLDRPTREIAEELVASAEPEVVAEMAVEFLVGVVAREQRQTTLDAERAAQQVKESARLPRKGTKARAEWEAHTPEGRAWAAREEEERMRANQMLNGVIARGLDRYAEELRVKWTEELLDSGFALRDGTMVKWGDATVEQHEERRRMFLHNAHANMEGAARHELAIRELRESGAATLRTMLAVPA